MTSLSHLPSKAVKPRKYRNVPCVVDGIRFDSKREARRHGELTLMQKAGLISNLRRQVVFELAVNDFHICQYRCDFHYVEKGQPITEDVKGVQTPEFKLKSKLMKAIHGVEIKLT